MVKAKKKKLSQDELEAKRLEELAANSEGAEAENQKPAELPPEILELVKSGQLPEEIVQGLESGEITTEQLMEYLQQLQEVPEEVEEKIQEEAKQLGIFEPLEADFQAMLFYSLNFLAEKSLTGAEEAMKQGESNQVNQFAKRAEIVRNVCKATFGLTADKDYYMGGFKQNRRFVGKISHEQMMEVSEFCASNVVLDEALQANPKLLRRTFAQSINSIKGIGIATKYRAILKEEFSKYAREDRPDKEGVVFELYMLFKVIEEVYMSLKNPQPEAQENIADEAEEK